VTGSTITWIRISIDEGSTTVLRRIVSSNTSLRRGTAAALVALSLPILMGVAALALDAGLLFIQRRQAQTIAEAVSTAAAYQLYLKNTSGATAAATALASQYGVSPTVSIPPTSGPFANKAGYVQVSITTSSPRVFSALWGAGSMSAMASAVAGSGTVPYSTAAILVLNPTGTSVTLSGSPAVTAKNGSIIVDSTSNAAVVSSGSTPGPSITAPVLDLSGKISFSGSNPNKATVTTTGQPNTPDPLAGITAPSSSGMTVQSNSAISLSGSTSRTLSPGVYNGGITLSGSASVTLSPGAYYINGGGINMSGSSSISGAGVFIYNTGGGAIDLSGSGGVSLSPMSTGPYIGITVFQDRSSTTGATLSGSGNMNNTGTFYFPDATLTLSGSSGVNAVGAQIIAKNLTFSGSAGIQVKFDSSVASVGNGFAIVQ
jgi:Flp pilus assembly protein TadG